jgi:methionine-R-sulfoxide reductase
VSVRHLLGADCNFLPLPNYLASSGFGAMMYIGKQHRPFCSLRLTFLPESDNAVLKPMWLSLLLALLVSDEHAWVVGSKLLDVFKVWDGVTLNGGTLLLNLKSNVFLSILEEMQDPDASSCQTNFVTSDRPTTRFSCLDFRYIASFDLRLAAAFRSFLSIDSVHRHEILRGVIRSSELFRHAPPTAEVLDARWHQAAFPRCIFVHKLPQMLQEFSGWDLSCASLPSKSWLSVAECPLVKSLTAPDIENRSSDGAISTTSESSPCGLPSNVAIDLSRSKLHHSDAEWQLLLSPLQFRVTRQQGTEPAFRNMYWNHHEDGVYFSVCSDTPLFDSNDKFDSGSGWPSFTKPIDLALVGETLDTSYGMKRVEVHSVVDGAHLGHVFEDGPAAFGGRRYCINSASLRFIPRADYKLWVANATLRLKSSSNGDSPSPSQEVLSAPLLPGDKHTLEMPLRYSKWRRQTSSDANCSWTHDGFSCGYPLRSFAIFMHTCSPAALLSMVSSTPCNLSVGMNSVYTLLLPSFTDCSHKWSDWISVQNASCFKNSIAVSIPCASTEPSCSAKHLLSLRFGDNTDLPSFDHVIGLPSRMIFCPFWLDQLVFYVTRSSDAIWWLGVSSVSAFPRLFDDFFIFKGGDRWLLELLQQAHPIANKDRTTQTEEPPSVLYSSMTADAAAIANHASSMVRPIPIVERYMYRDSSCDCTAVSACIF